MSLWFCPDPSLDAAFNTPCCRSPSMPRAISRSAASVWCRPYNPVATNSFRYSTTAFVVEIRSGTVLSWFSG
jgi:hypothetical protein